MHTMFNTGVKMFDQRKPMVKINFRLDQEDLDSLKEIAERINCDVSALVRYALKKHIIHAKKEFSKHPEVWGK